MLTPVPLSDEQVDELEKQHVERKSFGKSYCLKCALPWPAPWPCTTVALIASLREARAERDAALSRAVPAPLSPSDDSST